MKVVTVSPVVSCQAGQDRWSKVNAACDAYDKAKRDATEAFDKATAATSDTYGKRAK